MVVYRRTKEKLNVRTIRKLETHLFFEFLIVFVNSFNNTFFSAVRFVQSVSQSVS